jgi:heme exporter protein D
MHNKPKGSETKSRNGQTGAGSMTAKRIMAAAIGGVLVGLAGAAVAASNFATSRQSDFFAPGKHQFYVWCTGSSDYVATAAGKNAEDAQMRLYNANKAHGRATCWPVWQGRVPA